MDKLYDLAIVKYRRSPEDDWVYEICTQDDEESYYDTQATLTMIPDKGDGTYQELNSAQLETICRLDEISISVDMQKRIVDLLQLEEE